MADIRIPADRLSGDEDRIAERCCFVIQIVREGES